MENFFICRLSESFDFDIIENLLVVDEVWTVSLEEGAADRLQGLEPPRRRFLRGELQRLPKFALELLHLATLVHGLGFVVGGEAAGLRGGGGSIIPQRALVI